MSDTSSEESSNHGDPLKLIVRYKANEPPRIDVFAINEFINADFAGYMEGFWACQVNDSLIEGSTLQIYYSPLCGPTVTLDLDLFENSTFFFIDIASYDDILTFDEFSSFFRTAETNGLVAMPLNAGNQARLVDSFLSAFNDKYFVWALAYIASKPSISLFTYDQALSQVLLKHIKPFILNNFYSSAHSHRQCDFMNPPDNTWTDGTHLRQNKPQNQNQTRMYESLGANEANLLYFLSCQTGAYISYLFASIIDYREQFPFLGSLPPLVPSELPLLGGDAESLIIKLFEKRSTVLEKEQSLYIERLACCHYAVTTGDGDATLELVQAASNTIDPSIPLAILRERLFYSDEVSDDYLRSYIIQLPNEAQDPSFFALDGMYIPLEWVGSLLRVFNIPDNFLLQSILKNSIQHSIPKAIANSFCDVSKTGALVFSNSTIEPNVLLQPGCIVHPDTKIGHSSIIISSSIVMTDSVLEPYSILGMDSYKGSSFVSEDAVIHPSAVIESGAIVKRGATLCEGCLIQRGAIVGENAFIGRNVTVMTGAMVADGESVSECVTVPIGFVYSSGIIENYSPIPSLIEIRDHAFRKQRCGFIDLASLMCLTVVPTDFLLETYLETMASSPQTCLRELKEYQPKAEDELIFRAAIERFNEDSDFTGSSDELIPKYPDSDIESVEDVLAIEEDIFIGRDM